MKSNCIMCVRTVCSTRKPTGCYEALGHIVRHQTPNWSTISRKHTYCRSGLKSTSRIRTALSHHPIEHSTLSPVCIPNLSIEASTQSQPKRGCTDISRPPPRIKRWLRLPGSCPFKSPKAITAMLGSRSVPPFGAHGV